MCASETNWRKAGAETYTFNFSIETKQSTLELILKACTPFDLAQPIEKTLETWIYRRKLLGNNTIETPKLYAYGSGVLLEEFVPYELVLFSRILMALLVNAFFYR